LFDSRLSCGKTTDRKEEAQLLGSLSADVDASLEINRFDKSSTVRQGETMTTNYTTKTDNVKVKAKGTLVITIILGLATLLTTSLIAKTSFHG
jgi:hypothetical protein